jgi:hypothetical protein
MTTTVTAQLLLMTGQVIRARKRKWQLKLKNGRKPTIWVRFLYQGGLFT